MIEHARMQASFSSASQVAPVVKNPPANAGDVKDAGSNPGGEDLLEESMATHFSILAWTITWTEGTWWVPLSIRSHRVRHD